MRALFQAAGVSYPAKRLFLRAFKRERELEVWAGGAEGPLKKITSYDFCASSGELGPKRRQGDGQIPEGVYRVTHFLPMSNFHLGLGINYPNRSDRRHGHQAALGGNIVIHGDCVTIGCIPLSDEIEALYLMALDTHQRRGSAPIQVHIFPTRLDAGGLASLQEGRAEEDPLLRFWRSLAPIYEAFETKKEPPALIFDRRSGFFRLR